eukprot:SAG11_NODE_18960_length_477_cov_0.851852_1_plen_136_part_01
MFLGVLVTTRHSGLQFRTREEEANQREDIREHAEPDCHTIATMQHPNHRRVLLRFRLQPLHLLSRHRRRCIHLCLRTSFRSLSCFGRSLRVSRQLLGSGASARVELAGRRAMQLSHPPLDFPGELLDQRGIDRAAR